MDLFRQMSDRGVSVRDIAPTQRSGRAAVTLGCLHSETAFALGVLRRMPGLVEIRTQRDVFESIITAVFAPVG